MEYKVTLEKCREHLEEQLSGIAEPRKSPLMKQKLGFLISMFVIMALILLLNKLYWQPLLLVAAGGIFLPFYGSWSTKHQYGRELSEKILSLVNDPEMLWLNFIFPNKTMKEYPIKWNAETRSRISDTNMEVMAFLKKEGTSQGLHRAFPSHFKNTDSSNKHLGRLVLDDKKDDENDGEKDDKKGDKRIIKGIIEHTGNDYHYVPWKFTLIDEYEKILPGEENRKIEALLSEAFEEHLDGYYPEKKKMTPWERIREHFRERNKARLMHHG